MSSIVRTPVCWIRNCAKSSRTSSTPDHGRNDLYSRASDFICPFWSYTLEQERCIVQQSLDRVVRLHDTVIKPTRTIVFDAACVTFFLQQMQLRGSVRGMKRLLGTLVDAALARLEPAGHHWRHVEMRISDDRLIRRQLADAAAPDSAVQVSLHSRTPLCLTFVAPAFSLYRLSLFVLMLFCRRLHHSRISRLCTSIRMLLWLTLHRPVVHCSAFIARRPQAYSSSALYAISQTRRHDGS
jgi:hypothetical protein